MNPQKHILIVEDSPTQARYLAQVLRNTGYLVSVAATGQLAVEMSRTLALDLILLDVILPDMDGFGVCARVRQESESYIPVLMFTDQRTAVQDKIDGLAAGADDYISKAFDQRELLARIAALLRVKQLLDELRTRLTSEHQSYQALRRMALTDQLTGLYNRHYFMEALEREFSLAQRHGTPLACILSDIDHFRDFNNSHGHAIGDWVLRAAAELMKNQVRHSDIVGRYGGEEFVILLPMTGVREAADLAERMRAVVENQAWVSPAGPLHITISVGVASLPCPAITGPDQLLTCADQAMYQAKARGRNRTEIYAPPTSSVSSS